MVFAFCCFCCCGGRIIVKCQECCGSTSSQSQSSNANQPSLDSWNEPESKWVDNGGVFGANHEGENTPFLNGLVR